MTSEANASPSTERNKAVVRSFLSRMLIEKDPAAAAAACLGNYYIQHNPTVPDGVQGYVERFSGMADEHPDLRSEIVRIIAEGDYVVTHSHTTFSAGHEVAVADFWRLENGKIVEHWDVHQDVPSSAANDNTMF
jgi:predicted SnoaL-like aldol condensation-catalyzing enzyme